MTDVPQHQEAWEHKRAIREYEDFLENVFDRIGANPAKTRQRKAQFQALYDDPELWRDPDSFKKLYEDLRREILTLGRIHIGTANKRIREKFGPNSPHIVEART